MHLPRPALALVLLLTSCMTWASTPLPAPAPGRVDAGPFRIVGTDSFTRVARELTVDSLMVRYTREDKGRDSLPHRAVARIEVRKFNTAGTAVLAGAAILLGLAMSGMMDGMFSGGTGGTIY